MINSKWLMILIVLMSIFFGSFINQASTASSYYQERQWTSKEISDVVYELKKINLNLKNLLLK